jgi:epsilon-lactone hydrolase
MDLEALVNTFLGERGNRKDPLANPLYAGLPPIYIQVSGDEMLLDDSRRLAEHARYAGVDVRLDIFPEQQHTFHMPAGPCARGRRSDPQVGRVGTTETRPRPIPPQR